MKSVYPEFINKVVQLNSETSKNVATKSNFWSILDREIIIGPVIKPNYIVKCLTYEFQTVNLKLGEWWFGWRRSRGAY